MHLEFVECVKFAWKYVLKRVTVIKTRVNKGSGDSNGGGKVERR